MARYHEQVIVLRIRVDEDELGGAPSDWNWSELLDLSRPDGARVIAASENVLIREVEPVEWREDG